MIKDVRNSRRRVSLPYQSFGIVPAKSAEAAGERLVKESLSWMIPCPHGDVAAALKCCLLKRRRFLSIDDRSRRESHMISVSWFVERNS